jgi:hypothetical protein
MSPAASAKSNAHNVATFAGAVGGAIGFLALCSLGIAVSIIRRRVRAARRDRQWLERDTESDSGSTAGTRPPSMRGPAPFVPRYFPGTVPIAPPPYVQEATADSRSRPRPTLITTPQPGAAPSPLSPRPVSVRSPPPLISLMSPELRPQADAQAEEPPSYLEHTASPRIRPTDIPLLDMGAAVEFDYGLHGMNVPPTPVTETAIATPAPARPRPPPTPVAAQHGDGPRTNSNWLARFRSSRRQPSSSSLPHPSVAEADALMENEEETEIDSLHGI